MDNTSSVRVSKRAFVQSVLVLAALMIAAGVLTLVVPAGSYSRNTVEGRAVIDPASFRLVERPHYPVWRWLTAPFEVLGSSSGLIVIVIVVFLLFVGVSFAALERSGIIGAVVSALVERFLERRYALLAVASLVFMLMGAFFGTFEEIIILVPVMIALSYSLGWDALVGLGMSVLAANMGFSAAITNPFTIGVAQRLAGLPLFSGAWLRAIVFLAVYGILMLFLITYARRVERNPRVSLLHGQDDEARRRRASERAAPGARPEGPQPRRLRGGMLFFGASVLLIVAVLVVGVLVPELADVSLPVVGLLFLIGGVGAALVSGARPRSVARGAREGLTGLLPAIPLILVAASVSHIVSSGGVMDTLLHAAFQPFARLTGGVSSPLLAAMAVYFLALAIELLIASGSAKAFLMMPILLPLADLIGVTRQVTVTAYCFGDGFSNLAYPTNPALIICLGLAAVSYPMWMRWTARLWLLAGAVTLAFLGLAVAVGFGPF